MKNNKLNLITAILYLAASICFVFAAAVHTEMSSKALLGIAAVCSLIGSIGFFGRYTKNKKASGK